MIIFLVPNFNLQIIRKKEYCTQKMAREKKETISASSEYSEEQLSQKNWYSIDRSMIIPKVAYACTTAAVSSFEPYLLLILISVGLNPSDAGLVGGLRFIGGFVGGNIWGLIADYKKCHRLIILVVCAGAFLSMGGQPFLILWLGISSGNKCLKGNGNLSTANITLEKESINENFNEKNFFYSMLLVNTMVKFFDSAYRGFLDSGVIERCRINPRKPNFGFQRMFGSFGFAIGVLTSNIFVDNFPEAPVSCYIAVFITNMIFTMLLLISTQLLFRGLTFVSEENMERKKVNVWKMLIETLDAHVCFLLATVLIMGIQQSFYLNFTFLRLKEMNAPSLVYGLNIAAGSLTSGMFFFAGKYIINILGGTWPAMICGIFAYFFRFLAIAYTENPWFIPLIQTLQSFCFGLFLTATILHIKNITLPDIRTTLYSIMNSLHFSVGVIIANMSGGKLYEKYGGKKLFLLASIAALIWAIVATFYFLMFVKFNMFHRNVLKEDTKLKLKLNRKNQEESTFVKA